MLIQPIFATGKGTQAELLVKNLNFFHISCASIIYPYGNLLTSFHPAGELLRKECARPDSPHATFIKERIAQGDVVPYKLIMSLVKSEMSSALRSGRWANGIGKFILDGFPRDLDQAHSFDSEVSAFVLGNFRFIDNAIVCRPLLCHLLGL